MGRSEDIFVAKAQSQQECDACMAIRVKVFVDEQKFDPETEVDEYDEEALHFLAFYKQSPVGVARIVFKEGGKIAKVGRVAVLAPARKLGIGRAIMLAIEADPDIQDVEQFVLHSQLQAIPFYLQLGYIVEGDEFMEDGAPHRLMCKAGPGVQKSTMARAI